jgi:predicted hydrolase (HD superfamily)
MFLTKMIRFAEKIGMDVDELMEMTVLDAMMKIEETRSMWADLAKEIG